MTLKQAMVKLKSLGTAQTRKTYGRHGVTGEMFGVKFGDMYKVAGQIKCDHELALALWETGNHDARMLAVMIADPAGFTATALGRWIKDVDNHVLSRGLAGVACKSPAGPKLMPKWMAAKGEWPRATGWMMLALRAQEPAALTKTEARKQLAHIQKHIHESQNRVKYSMNTALIALGTYVPGLEEAAVRAAQKIGQVEVDHGLTDCQTPLAEPYIRKAAAHHRAKLARAAAKSTAKRKTTLRASARR